MSGVSERINEEELAFEVALLLVPGISGRVLAGLRRQADELIDIWRAGLSQLRRWGLTEKQAAAVVRNRRLVSPAEIMMRLKKQKIRVWRQGEVGYPPLLAEAAGAPPLVFVRSRAELSRVWSRPVVAVVGSRKPTGYGLAVTRQLVGELAEAGVVVVSGLAYGIDSRAHRVCMEHGGVTVAVLPGGAGVVSPSGNRQLAERIVAEGGVLVWEYGARVRVTRGSFPLRNRLVAGMSRAVLVVEGQQRSGSMITPKLAADLGREVMAVPGPVTSPQSAGPNSLIKQGAKVVTGVADVLEELAVAVPVVLADGAASVGLTGRQRRVWLAYEKWGREVDKLVRESGVGVEEVLGYLTEWELTGRV